MEEQPQNIIDKENVMKEKDFERYSQDDIEFQKIIEASLKRVADEIDKRHSNSEKEQDDYVSKSGLVSNLVEEMIKDTSPYRNCGLPIKILF